MKRVFLYPLISVISISLLYSQPTSPIESSKDTNSLLNTPAPFSKPIPAVFTDNKWGYLGTSFAVSVIGGLAGAGLLYLMPESVTNWDKNEIKHLGSNWIKKIEKGPVVDPDDLWLNLAGHPYAGSIYYLQARRAGFNWAFSTFYSFLNSTFLWEYGIEGFAETPSWQDLVLTPAIGSMWGELSYLAITKIRENDSKIGDSAFFGGLMLFLFDPFGYIIQDFGLGRALGLKEPQNLTSFYMPKQDGFSLIATYRW